MGSGAVLTFPTAPQMRYALFRCVGLVSCVVYRGRFWLCIKWHFDWTLKPYVLVAMHPAWHVMQPTTWHMLCMLHMPVSSHKFTPFRAACYILIGRAVCNDCSICGTTVLACTSFCDELVAT